MHSGAVLFDFDGTLADTAADLGAAMNRMRRERGLAELPIEKVRPWASAGARGLLRAGFDMLPEHPQFEPMRDTFLAYYDEAPCVETKLFPGMDELLRALEARGIAWGIVTNKATRFTRKIVAALQLDTRVACVVSGDTTPHLKPNPASLLHAAKELALAPKDCVYLGDDLRDVQAARAAGMRSVAVEWGYGSGLSGWNADAVIARPMDLMTWL
ncbi:MAG TPA: HAD-IA family hydrolase [Burkholderiales bacterium]|nr:HAD-IA family hydrolase [Burkholderiales bacterium]